MGECSEAMRQKFKAEPGYESFEAATNFIDLLRTIKKANIYLSNSQLFDIGGSRGPTEVLHSASGQVCRQLGVLAAVAVAGQCHRIGGSVLGGPP